MVRALEDREQPIMSSWFTRSISSLLLWARGTLDRSLLTAAAAAAAILYFLVVKTKLLSFLFAKKEKCLLSFSLTFFSLFLRRC